MSGGGDRSPLRFHGSGLIQATNEELCQTRRRWADKLILLNGVGWGRQPLCSEVAASSVMLAHTRAGPQRKRVPRSGDDV